MAIVFNGTNSALRTASFGASRPVAYSVACWVKFTSAVSAAKTEIVVAAGNALGFPNDLGDLAVSWSHSSPAFRNRASIHTSGFNYIGTNTAGGTTTGLWVHRAAVYTGAGVLFYENGLQVGATAAATVTAASPADWFFSVGGGAANDSPCACKTAMSGYWDIGLLAADVAALGAGYAPEKVRPQSLRAYFPGLSDANNYSGSGSVAANLTFDSDAPRIML